MRGRDELLCGGEKPLTLIFCWTQKNLSLSRKGRGKGRSVMEK